MSQQNSVFYPTYAMATSQQSVTFAQILYICIHLLVSQNSNSTFMLYLIWMQSRKMLLTEQRVLQVTHVPVTRSLSLNSE